MKENFKVITKEIKGKIDENKNKKENALLDAAYKLFIKQGVENTTIQQITNEASVAKGTFYLYFKDKIQIEKAVVMTKASEIIYSAIDTTLASQVKSPDDELIMILEYILNHLKDNISLLAMIKKNLSWGLFKEIHNPNSPKKEGIELNQLLNTFSLKFIERGFSQEEMSKIFFFIFEMVSSTAYACFLEKIFTDTKKTKITLYKSILKILSPNSITDVEKFIIDN